MANFSGGGGGTGLLQGIQAGNMLVDAYYRGRENSDRADVRNVMSQGIDNAKAQRQAAIDSNVVVGSKASDDNTMTMPTYQDAKGTSFASEGDARASAEKSAPSVDDFYVKNVVPKIAETYLKQGNVDQADKWNSWAQQKNTQTGMKHWTKALQAGQIGDFKGYADNMVKAYNAPGYYDDGLEADGYDLVKDKDGNTTGLTLNLRNKSTGEKFSKTVNGQDDMVKMGIGLLDPANAFKTTQAAVATAQANKARADQSNLKFKQDVYRDDRKGQIQIQRQDQRDNASMDRLVTGKQLDEASTNSTVDNKVRALKSAGYDDGFIKDALPQILGIGQYKKPAAPDEVRRMLHQEHLKDFTYQRKSPEEQSKILDKDISIIGSAGNPMSSGIPAQGGAAKPATGAAKPAAGGAPMIYDTQTGQMVPYKR